MINRLQEPSSIEKVAEVDEHIGVALSGLTADARTLIDHARVEAQQYRFTYNEPIPVESLTQSLCDLALRFGEDDDEGGGMVRERLQNILCMLSNIIIVFTSDIINYLRAAMLVLMSLFFLSFFQSRPFGVAWLVAGWDDEHGPVL